MSERMTDRNAIRVALLLAIDAEESLIDAYTGTFSGKVDETEDGVIIARRRVKAFNRVLDRYYPGERPKSLDDGKKISIFDIMRGEREQQP